jgi:hypothetical protein
MVCVVCKSASGTRKRRGELQQELQLELHLQQRLELQSGTLQLVKYLPLQTSVLANGRKPEHYIVHKVRPYVVEHLEG